MLNVNQAFKTGEFTHIRIYQKLAEFMRARRPHETDLDTTLLVFIGVEMDNKVRTRDIFARVGQFSVSRGGFATDANGKLFSEDFCHCEFFFKWLTYDERSGK